MIETIGGAHHLEASVIEWEQIRRPMLGQLWIGNGVYVICYSQYNIIPCTAPKLNNSNQEMEIFSDLQQFKNNWVELTKSDWCTIKPRSVGSQIRLMQPLNHTHLTTPSCQ